jgi:hypothetical protein
VAVILSSKTIVAIEVHQEGNELLVKTLGAGSRDWFADAPQMSEGSLVRELLHPDSWPALEKVKNSMANTIGASAVQMGMYLDVHLGHFHSSTCVSTPCTDRTGGLVHIYAQKVEYVRASIDVAMRAVGEKQPVAVIIFNLPAEWQWVSVPKTVAVMTYTHNLELWACKPPSAPAEVSGRWMHVGGGQAAEEMCKSTEVVNAAAPLALAGSSSDIDACKVALPLQSATDFVPDATLASTHPIANCQHCPCAAILRASLYFDADLHCPDSDMHFSTLLYGFPQHGLTEAVGLTNVRVRGRATATSTFVQSATFSPRCPCPKTSLTWTFSSAMSQATHQIHQSSPRHHHISQLSGRV